MHRLLYISTMRQPLSGTELATILRVSRRNNTAAGVTGLLMVGGRRFLQALEGEEATVIATFERIGRDPRHFAVTSLSRGAVEARQFPDWAMGYQGGGDVAEGGTLAEAVRALIAPIADPTLRAYFSGFAELHLAA